MATSKVPAISFPAQPSNLPLTITAEQISKYAEISNLVSGLETQKEQLRAELLKLHAAGAEQEETSPYLLKPNAAFAAGITPRKPAVSERRPQ